MGVEQQRFARGEKIIFRRGGGEINAIFGPKYRPLHGHHGNKETKMFWKVYKNRL
jgi:hypothetical protein